MSSINIKPGRETRQYSPRELNRTFAATAIVTDGAHVFVRGRRGWVQLDNDYPDGLIVSTGYLSSLSLRSIYGDEVDEHGLPQPLF